MGGEGGESKQSFEEWSIWAERRGGWGKESMGPFPDTEEGQPKNYPGPIYSLLSVAAPWRFTIRDPSWDSS